MSEVASSGLLMPRVAALLGLVFPAMALASGASALPESAEARAGDKPRPAAARGAGGEARLRAMIDEHFDFIWRSLRRLGVPPTDVDDCAQQVFLVASRKLDVIAAGSERSFLFGTAMRVASDERRSRVRRREVSMEADAAAAPGDETLQHRDPGLSPEEIAEQRRARAVLDEVLAQLPLDLRTVFVLFELEEMPTQDIAALLDIPVGTAASRLRRAREEFQRVVARVAARARGGKA